MTNEMSEIIDALVRHDTRNCLTIIAGNIGLIGVNLIGQEKLESMGEIISSIRKTLYQKGEKPEEEIKENVDKLSSLIKTIPNDSKSNGNNFVEKAEKGIERMEQIIDEARFYRKNLESEKFSLNQVVKEVGEFLDLEICLKGELEFFAYCLFPSVLGNLFQNAIKHGGASKIKASVKEKAKGVVIIIEDNGKGIPKENKSKIFINGYSGNGGSGQGLFLCRRILSFTEAKITETSNSSRKRMGARFEIFIPNKDVISPLAVCAPLFF